jgi:2-polyprenyl-3-methyl-5-hydroxy-6-metoxy-1,4-benzoquinol methylase
MSLSYLSACPIGCDEPLQATGIEMPEGPLLQCSGCGQLISQCSEEKYRQSMREFNTAEGTQPRPDALRRRFRRSRKYLEQIEKILNKPRSEIRLLDAGCSSGYFLTVANQLGFYAEGVEPGLDAVQTARAAGLTVHSGLLEDVALPEQSFDAITLFEVIEHLKEARNTIQRCNRLLRPGGILVIGTANTASWTFMAMKSRWEYFHIDKHGGHVSFFNPGSMKILAQRSGFVVEKIETRSVSFSERDATHPIIYRACKIISELIETPSRWIGRGHDMLVIMRKVQTVQYKG